MGLKVIKCGGDSVEQKYKAMNNLVFSPFEHE